jgi:hypothetical protein
MGGTTKGNSFLFACDTLMTEPTLICCQLSSAQPVLWTPTVMGNGQNLKAFSFLAVNDG